MEKHDNVIARGRDTCRSFPRISYPHEVVGDPHLTADEKRAMLSAWASDRHAVESLPALRHLPGTPFPVTFSSIMDARALLDRLAGANDDDPPSPRPMAKRARPRLDLGEAA